MVVKCNTWLVWRRDAQLFWGRTELGNSSIALIVQIIIIQEVFYEMYFGIQVSEHFVILRLYWSESTLGPNWLQQKDVHPSEIYFSGMVSHLSSENWVEMSDLIHLKSIWVCHAKWMKISNGHNQMITQIWV